MLIRVFCVVSMLNKLPPGVCWRGGGGGEDNRLAEAGREKHVTVDHLPLVVLSLCSVATAQGLWVCETSTSGGLGA